ncbi:MAG: redoxin domain-containing protein [Candidatus Peribacteraceae bacterium]|nr:redoxin domain-containing protein [Candidatus Peribacteraceae bacterium]
MISVFLTLFAAGLVTILLPCILPLIPVVLGVSIVGKSRLRPLVTIGGMVISFVAFTFILQVLLSNFVTFADVIQTSTYYVLLLFGICFLTNNRLIQLLVAAVGGFFYWKFGWVVMTVAEVGGWLAIEIGGRVASKIQQLGSDVQQSARSGLGSDSLLTAFIVGLTLGLVWVPCAGPALGFALALVREEPGAMALGALAAYGLGAAVPLLIVAYGGQWAVHSVRALSQYTGRIKQFAGAILIITAIGFQYGWLMTFQAWLTDVTGFGNLGSRIEEQLFATNENSSVASVPSVLSSMTLPKLPKITRAPEFTGLGPWHNSPPFTLASLKGKIVLVDFWTYSCINCIRTLPYMEGYWNKFKDQPFLLLGVHTPEFVFEKSERNVADAIKRHGLTYPTAQDNDFGTWNAFANRYWPAKYLIDADGYIRYTHFGEGGYEETDLAIQSLLKEIGATAKGPMIGGDQQPQEYRDRSPETYLGERSWPAFFNSLGDPDDAVHTYTAPSSLPLNRYALVGDWQLSGDGEHQILRSSEGEIRYQALAAEVNLVLGLEEGISSVNADVFVDGKKTKSITIVPNDLYSLFTGDYGEHEIILKIHGKGVAGYAYTFGS